MNDESTETATDSKKLHILVFPLPVLGHMNPLSCIIRGLVDTNKVHVVCYGTSDVRSLVEKSGAKYRSYMMLSHNRMQFNCQMSAGLPTSGELFDKIMDASSEGAVKLADLIDSEQPDLIIYDEMALYAKFALMLLNKRRHGLDAAAAQCNIPPAVMFRSGFAMNDVYPNNVEKELFKPSFMDLFSLAMPLLKLLAFNVKHGFWDVDFVDLLWKREEQLSIVCVFPELQPRSHLFSKSNKFVGICLHEEMRSITNVDAQVKALIDMFEPINPISEEHLLETRRSRRSHLILVSFGTVFNQQIDTFVVIIEALKSMHDSNRYTIIVAVGAAVFESLQQRQMSVPHNMVITPFAPQIEILKRASVFITHCGINSVNESIFFGVPLVCVPISADQPRVAYRVADELGLGIRVNLWTMSRITLTKAVSDIISDDSYHQRMVRFSSISRQYDGVATATKEILTYAVEKSKTSVSKKNK